MRDPEEAVQDPASEVVQADAEAGAVDLGEDPVQRPPAPDIGDLVSIYQRHRHQHPWPGMGGGDIVTLQDTRQ